MTSNMSEYLRPPFRRTSRTADHRSVYDSTCETNYIRDASEPWPSDEYDLHAPGRYHDECSRLYLTSYVLLVAGSLSMLRAIPVQFFPVGSPS